MTVKDLIELNAMITDLVITVRIGEDLLLDQLNIGCSEGIKPPYPTRVPKDPRYAGNCNQSNDEMYKDAAYIPKSINAWDDGKDYYEIKLSRIPAKWLDLEVISWTVGRASSIGVNPRRHNNNTFHGERLQITALPSGESLEVKEKPSKDTDEELPGQMNINDFLGV
jgi:hypothetical protein